MAEQMKSGWRPRRTLVFATWDAEEWGLIGSSEYAEDDSLRLTRGGVAYLNQDGAAGGPYFGGGGTPTLRAMLRDVAKSVPDPSGGGSVYDVWREAEQRRRGRRTGDGRSRRWLRLRRLLQPSGHPALRLGIRRRRGHVPLELRFLHVDGALRRSRYRYHAAAARIGTAMMMRLANADVLPYDYVEFARTMRRLPRADRHEPRGEADGRDPRRRSPRRSTAWNARPSRSTSARDQALRGTLAIARNRRRRTARCSWWSAR